MCAGQFWGALWGALSQFIDIQAFDLLTTGMSPRLRQHNVLRQKANGPLALPLPLHGCHGEHMSPSAVCHIHVGTFSFSFPLSFLFLLWLSVMLFPYRVVGGHQRKLPKHWQCPVCHGHPHTTHTVQRGPSTVDSMAYFPKLPSNRILRCCGNWETSTSVSGQVVSPSWGSNCHRSQKIQLWSDGLLQIF